MFPGCPSQISRCPCVMNIEMSLCQKSLCHEPPAVALACHDNVTLRTSAFYNVRRVTVERNLKEVR